MDPLVAGEPHLLSAGLQVPELPNHATTSSQLNCSAYSCGNLVLTPCISHFYTPTLIQYFLWSLSFTCTSQTCDSVGGKSVPWNWCLVASRRQSALAAVSRVRARERRVRNIMSGVLLSAALCGVLSTTWAGQLEAGVAGAEAEVEQGEVTRQRGVQAGEAGCAQQQRAACTHTAVIIRPPCTAL